MIDIIKDPTKSYLVNPKIQIKIIGDFGFYDHILIDEQEMEVEITKDMEEEPNEAEITIYNLSEGTRGLIKDAANKSAPIEIALTAAGSEELVTAFKGELTTARSTNTRPGHGTYISAESQKTSHRAAYVGNSYSTGTPVAAIVAEFIDIIGLPARFTTLPTDVLLLSQTFSGPAFPMLKKFMFDFDMYTFIDDGVLIISSAMIPQNPTPHLIYNGVIRSRHETERNDVSDIEQATIASKVSLAPTARKKKKKTKQKPGATGYVEFEAVDIEIEGMDFSLLMQPERKPDDIISFPQIPEIATTLYRIREHTMSGDNYTFDLWDSEIVTDVYNPGL